MYRQDLESPIGALTLEALLDEDADFESGALSLASTDGEAAWEGPDFEAAPADGHGIGLAGESLDPELELYGSDDRRLVTDTRSAPYRWIVNLTIDFPGLGRRPWASGTLIGPRTVLTAGHCIWDKAANRLRDPRRMQVVPGRAGASAPFGAAQAVGFVTPPGWAGAASYGGTKDYALIHLATPIGSSVGYWRQTYARTATDPVGSSTSSAPVGFGLGKLQVHVSGYPGDMPASGMGCRAGSKPTCSGSGIGAAGRDPRCGAYQYRATDRFMYLKFGMLTHKADTCPGHSGSPVWVRRAPEQGGRVLIGVHVAGGNKAVPISATVLQFIRANLK